ncbi:MAG TPA: AAA family ATPase [Caulobacteraceae bacterium]|jgi:predicted ATPase
MQRYILTGAPGAGKTAILRQLEADGASVVEEAATDVIALEHALGRDEPHARPDFIDKIIGLQGRRQLAAAARPDAVQIHDRSPVCTYALSRFLNFPASPILAAELARIEAEGVYQRWVLFIENLGFVTPTAARRISFADTLRFEIVHEQVYQELGYELVRIEPGALGDRVAAVQRAISLAGLLRSSEQPV